MGDEQQVADAGLIVYTACQVLGKEPILNRTQVTGVSLAVVHQNGL